MLKTFINCQQINFGNMDEKDLVSKLGERFWTDTDKLFLVRQYDGIFGPTKKGVPRPT